MRLVLFFLGLWLSTLPLLWADTLEQIKESDEMLRFEREAGLLKSRNREIDSWADPASVYASIFDRTAYGRELLSFLGAQIPGFTRSGEERRRNDDLVKVWADFKPHTGLERYNLTVMVPFPRVIPSIELGLMKDFSALEPPALKVQKEEQLTVRGYPARLFTLSESQHVMLFKLDKEVRVSLSCTGCASAEALTAFARQLDIGRLNRKLNS